MLEILEYAICFFVSGIGWVMSFGMFCCGVRASSGVYVKFHGWTCDCGDGGQQ